MLKALPLVFYVFKVIGCYLLSSSRATHLTAFAEVNIREAAAAGTAEQLKSLLPIVHLA